MQRPVEHLLNPHVELLREGAVFHDVTVEARVTGRYECRFSNQRYQWISFCMAIIPAPPASVSDLVCNRLAIPIIAEDHGKGLSHGILAVKVVIMSRYYSSEKITLTTLMTILLSCSAYFLTTVELRFAQETPPYAHPPPGCHYPLSQIPISCAG